MEEKSIKKVLKRKHLRQQDVKKYSKTELNHIILKIKANERKYMFITTLIFLTIILLTFGIVITSINRKIFNDNSIKTKNLIINYKEQENGIGNIIDLVNVKKYNNHKFVKDYYEVTITNKTNKDITFEILLKDDIEMIEYDHCKDIFLDRKYLRYNVNNSNDLLVTKDRILYKTIKSKSKETYKIKIWVDNSYSGIPHYHGKLEVREIKK